MMKKLMVLSLVLAVASLANAGLTLVDLGGGAVGIASDAKGAWDGYFASSSNLVIVESGLTAEGNKNLSFVENLGPQKGSDLALPELGSFNMLWVNVASSNSADPVVEGTHFSALFSGVTFGDKDMGLGRVDLLSNDLSSVLATLYVVPEPMTMGLLSLGALFIRRRK